MKTKYVIKEFDGDFEIGIQGYETTGMWWWKKKHKVIYRCNIWGGVIQTFPILQPIQDTFKTLKDAEDKVKSWQKGATYHKIP